MEGNSTISYAKEVGGILIPRIVFLSFPRFFFKMLTVSKYAFWGTYFGFP